LIEGHSSGVLDSKKPAEVGGPIVALSALLPSAADPFWIECSQWEELFGQICPSLVSPAGLLDQVDQELIEFAPVLKLTVQGKSLVESHQEAVAPV
jgi:hypothetical protein